jgi:hypothetical protein
MHHELWDTRSRNMIDDFATEAEALDQIRAIIAADGPGITDTLLLGLVSDDGRTTTVAAGTELAARAEAAAQKRGRLPA